MTSPIEVIEEEAERLRLEREEFLSGAADAEGDDEEAESEIVQTAMFQRGDHVELAHHLVDTMRVSGDVVFTEGSLHQYAAVWGTWCTVDEATQSKIVQDCAGATVRTGKHKTKPLRLRSSDVHGSVRLARDQLAHPGFFNDRMPGLAFANGFMKIDRTGFTFLPHSADHRAQYAFPFDYNPDARRPMFDDFLAELFVGDADAHEKALFLQEFFGTALIGRSTEYQKALVLLGEKGSNGKSTLIKIVDRVMPFGTTSAIPPQDWDQEYRRNLIVNKLLNMVSELPENDIMATESFKAMVTGDPMLARPIREAPFTFHPKAGHVFAANKLPGSSDGTNGFWRRFVVVRCNRQFAEQGARRDIDKDIVSSERQGIVLWMLEGAARVARNGGYGLPPSSDAERDHWKLQANPAALFLEECTHDAPVSSLGTVAAALYVQFRVWCEQNGHRVPSSTKFGMRLRELGKSPEKRRDGWWYPVLLKLSGVRSS